MKGIYASMAVFAVTSAGAWTGCSSDQAPGGAANSGSASGGAGGDAGSGSSGAVVSGSGTSGNALGTGSGSSSGGDAGSGNASGSDAGSGAGTSDAGGEAGPITWTRLYGDLVARNCAPCHSPAADGGSGHDGFLVGHLDMSSADAGYASLVNQSPQGAASDVSGYQDAAVCATLASDAAAEAGILRVRPGDPATSLLSLKVRGYFVPPPCGAPMPAGGELAGDGGPDQSRALQEVRMWILAGAKP